ncbi:cystathionine beta-lyase [Segnochrobactrum spirostomi]|uniref:Cystathionine beta-lyase n=1 Tax=Segnochrobactrum spirostomi TaxID=2608987 RepID=A0A6A7Y2Y2_9HYPH|nr:cystathionine beta-lyase [Segnochrobactrum spirostomi]MQT12149.1 cystathionine beta-lyase [Segnochrobactrum spirostomi]
MSNDEKAPESARNAIADAALQPATRLVHGGYDGKTWHGFVNPPVVHASTVLFESADAHFHNRARYTYGRQATPTTEALQDAVSELEGAAGTKLAPSGLGAVTLALLSCLSAGDHLLMVDTTYGPTRHFCDTLLARLGVETTYYDPHVGAGIAALMRPNTKAVFLEAPGTATFEMQDIPAIVAVARAHGATVLMDNTWATPLYFKPLAFGVDLSIQAATKYFCGHSDVLLGTVAASERALPALAATHRQLGLHTAPDDVYQIYRGLKTLEVRLARHHVNGVAVAEWLLSRPEVTRVRHPALPSDPGHALWKRDFSGASGLFAFDLAPVSETALAAFFDTLTLFGMGYSWGGYESLAIRARPDLARTAVPWTEAGPVVRLHIGLEDPRDLTADLARGFAAMAAA